MKTLSNILWTALVTPLKESGEIDFDCLKNLVQMQNEAGNGLVIAGSTGEGMSLSDDEKKALIDFVTQQNLQVPVMATVPGAQLEKQLEWMDYCKKVDAYMLVMPHYTRPGYHGQLQWFQKLLDHSTLPCILYNVPTRTACQLHVDVLHQLANHPNLIGLKEASGSLEDFRRYKQAAPNLQFYSGNDNLTWELIQLGASGLIAVMSNAYPQATRKFVEECFKGHLNDFISACTTASVAVNNKNPHSIKMALFKKGLISTPTLRPPLSHLDVENETSIRDSDKILAELENLLPVVGH